MRTGAMAAAVLNSAKVDLGPMGPGEGPGVGWKTFQGGKARWGREKKNKQWGKEKAGWGPSFFWAGKKFMVRFVGLNCLM